MMDGRQFLRDLYDFLVGWAGLPTFRERTQQDSYATNLSHELESLTEREILQSNYIIELSTELSRIHQHYKSMFS